MNNLISISEVVASVELADGCSAEILAQIEGTYDGATALLSLRLSADARVTFGAPPLSRAAWLPTDQIVKEHVGSEEATTLAREVFHHWVGKVRNSIPTPAALFAAKPSEEQVYATHH